MQEAIKRAKGLQYKLESYVGHKDCTCLKNYIGYKDCACLKNCTDY